MSENQACHSQAHVATLRYLKVKPRRRGLNRQLKGGTGSHTVPNHVIKNQMVNVTLARGHHTQTWRTARNAFHFVYDSSTPNKIVHYYILLGKMI
jgi:hypothetical protein